MRIPKNKEELKDWTYGDLRFSLVFQTTVSFILGYVVARL